MTDYISREEALNFELSVEAEPEDIQAITKGMALYAEHIKSIPAADVIEGGWIPVTERLPDVWKHVITFDEDDGVRVNWRCGDNVSWNMGYHVTHWMPLPEPPKEDEA